MAFTLSQLQQVIRDTYGVKDRRRGVEGTFMWFMEEVGELAAALRSGTPEEQAAESADSDEVVNNYSVPVPPVDKNESFTVLAYTKPGSTQTDISVRVLIEGQNICPPYKKNPSGLESGEMLYLTVGSRLPWLRRALR